MGSQRGGDATETGAVKTPIGPDEEDLAIGVWDRLKAVQWSDIAIPFLAIFTALLVGAVFIWITKIYEMSLLESKPPFREMATQGLSFIWDAYRGLFEGALGSPRALATSLVYTTPYILAGLAVALGFKCGLFNIGAEGQLYMGALCATVVGFSVKGLPIYVHLPLAIIAGALGGAVWGAIPGLLKAWTGAHEVINTIMMNYIAFRLSDYLLTGPMKRPDSFVPASPDIQPSAMLPRFFADPIRFHLGFFIALAVAYAVYWFLFRTRWGFDLRTVGANPNAARYAGMSIMGSTVLAMSLSGALGGLAGTNEVLGVNHNLAMAFSAGYGFDSIALALLGKSHPLGVVLAALLFGTLRNGATRMQVAAGIPIDIISILQALILAFIAAPAIIRTIYRLRAPAEAEETIFARGWGGD